jgi:hypothetical protein
LPSYGQVKRLDQRRECSRRVLCRRFGECLAWAWLHEVVGQRGRFVVEKGGHEVNDELGTRQHSDVRRPRQDSQARSWCLGQEALDCGLAVAAAAQHEQLDRMVKLHPIGVPDDHHRPIVEFADTGL